MCARMGGWMRSMTSRRSSPLLRHIISFYWNISIFIGARPSGGLPLRPLRHAWPGARIPFGSWHRAASPSAARHARLEGGIGCKANEGVHRIQTFYTHIFHFRQCRGPSIPRIRSLRPSMPIRAGWTGTHEAMVGPPRPKSMLILSNFHISNF